jgi:hypothetical protein
MCQHCSQAYYLHQLHPSHGLPQPSQPPQTQPPQMQLGSAESFTPSQSTSSITPLAWELPNSNSFTPNTTNQTRLQAAIRHHPNPSQLPFPTQGIAINPMMTLPTVSLHRASGSQRRGNNNPGSNTYITRNHPTATGFETIRYLIFINPEPVSDFYFYFYCLSLKIN